MTSEELQRLNGPLYQECIGLAISLTKERTLALDLVQESYYLAHKYLHKYEDNTNLSSWIKRIVYNTFASHYRRDKRRKELLSEKPPTDSWINQNTVENPVMGKLCAEDLSLLIERIPQIYRKTFLMMLRGMNYQQISNCLDVPVGTVKSRVFTARKLLRVQISDL
ncbi:RNA polymerase sigma factor [Neolewinella persica]|uniref:RNA polymerase sigma factor n=1 Tax=Neolewinella persica TaxID=70998 RepID=UPI00036E9F02|nr:sigma-70 family RNA polymerase sigma factor [Neolewinella persica]